MSDIPITPAPPVMGAMHRERDMSAETPQDHIPATKKFPIGAVLSVVTGRLVSENHMDGVYEVLNWMTGESLYTHQLPRVSAEARPVILAMHPSLATAVDEAEQVTRENWKDWLAVWRARYGIELDVPSLNFEQHERIDPLSELAEIVHPSRIIIAGSS